MSQWDRYCRVCETDGVSTKALYIVTTSQVTGPRARTAMKLGGGKYCLAHARERAAELTSAWEQRRADEKAASKASHEAWRGNYVQRELNRQAKEAR